MKTRYWLTHLRYFLPDSLLFQRAQLWSFETNQFGEFEGIVLTTTLPNRAENERFVQTTKEALAWLKEQAPRHYNRVRRYTRFICDQPILSPAQWSERNKACIVDFSRWAPHFAPDEENQNWHLAYYATVLVHEATHGRLCALSFPYNKATRQRVEHLCTCEQLRTLACLWEWESAEAREAYFRKWEHETQEAYETYWQQSLWQRWPSLKNTLRRVLKREP